MYPKWDRLPDVLGYQGSGGEWLLTTTPSKQLTPTKGERAFVSLSIQSNTLTHADHRQGAGSIPQGWTCVQAECMESIFATWNFWEPVEL
jgi:hypothetical protein